MTYQYWQTDIGFQSSQWSCSANITQTQTPWRFDPKSAHNVSLSFESSEFFMIGEVDTSTLQHGKKNAVPKQKHKKRVIKSKNVLVGGFNPIWKICSSKWVHLPQFSGWKFQRMFETTTQCGWAGSQAVKVGKKTSKRQAVSTQNKGPPLETDSLLAVFVEGLRYIRCYFGNTTGAIFLQSYTCIQW